MTNITHINVTVDFSKRMEGGGQYDLRIPVQLNVKQLLPYLLEALNMDYMTKSGNVIKVLNKNLLIADDDYLADFPVTDGDIFLIL